MNNWAFTGNKPPTYWFGDQVYHKRYRRDGVVVGMNWNNLHDGQHHWTYLVLFRLKTKNKRYIAHNEDLELKR